MNEKPSLLEARITDDVHANEAIGRSMALVVAGDAGVESYEPHSLLRGIGS
jgi:hypothetical protein